MINNYCHLSKSFSNLVLDAFSLRLGKGFPKIILTNLGKVKMAISKKLHIVYLIEPMEKEGMKILQKQRQDFKNNLK